MRRKDKPPPASKAGTKYVLPQHVFEERKAGAKGEINLPIYLGRIPKGTTEDAICSECAKYGTVGSIFYTDDMFEEPWALVSFKSPESVANAVSRFNRRLGIFGATHPVEVRQGTSEDIRRMEALLEEQDKKNNPQPDPPPQLELVDPFADPYAMERGRSDSRSYSRGRGKRRRDDGYGGQALMPAEPRGLGGFAANTSAIQRAQVAHVVDDEFSGGKQIGTKRGWAEFIKADGRTYYVNALTGEKARVMPRR